jgi:O-acetylserine/cysteine efflux transporter
LSGQDIAMGVAVALLWGMGVVFAKAAIGHFPPILLMALRFTVTALVLVWFVKPPWRLLSRIFAIALVSAAIQYSLTFHGLAGLDASTAVLVLQLEVPFLVLLGVVMLKETPGMRKWIGIAISFFGVAFIAGEPQLSDAWLPLGLVVGGSATWALGQIMIRKLGGEVGGFALIAWVSVMAAPQLFVFSWVFEDNQLDYIRSADWVVWGTVFYLGLIMTALGYGLWYTLVERHPINRVAPFLLLLPVFGVIGGVALLGESLTLRIAGGGALVIAGVAFILFERAPKLTPEPIAAIEPRPGADA